MTAPFKPQIKQPAEVSSAVFSFPTLPFGANLVSAVATVLARGLVVGSLLVAGVPVVSADAARVKLSGGVNGERYLVTVRATDNAGDAHESEQEFLVVDLAWATPEGTTPYLSLAEFVVRCGYERTLRLTDENGRTLDKDVLAAALLDAQGTVDDYLAGRTAVPLTLPVPRTIATLVYDLALARLYADGAPEGVSSNAKLAVQQLRDFAAGKLPLPAELAVVPAPVSATPILSEGPSRLFTRDSMSGF